MNAQQTAVANLVVDNTADQSVQQYSGAKTKFRIYFDSPFWLIQVRNPDSESGWQHIRKNESVIVESAKGLPQIVFPLHHFASRTEAVAFCTTSLQGSGIEEYVRPRQTLWKRMFGQYED